MLRRFPAIASLALNMGLIPAYADETTTDTLKKISEFKTITIGHRESAVPFAYYNEKQEVVGYSQDLMEKIIQRIKTEYNLPDLTVQKKLVTAQNRIPYLLAGEIDIECGATTNNAERRKQVDFSNTLFVASIRMMVKKDSKIKDFADLAGKNVATTQGTTAETLLQKANADKDEKQQTKLILAKEHGQSFLNLEQGKAAAFVMDDILLAGERAKAKKPNNWIIIGTAQSREAYGCILRKGDTRFKQLVDDTLAQLMTSGEADAIYKKWFQSPIPPNGVNLNYPMSEDMKALYKEPSDKGFN